MKKPRIAKKFIEELERTPIIQIACDKVGISRNTAYRWMKEDTEFLQQVSEAMSLGVGMVNDVAESNVLAGIKAKDAMFTKYWLSHRHPQYRKPFIYRVESDDLLEHNRIIREGEKKAQVEKDIETASKKQSESRIAEKKARAQRMIDSWTKSDENEKTKIQRLALEMHKEWIKNNHDPFKDNS